jgi:hypothetical protein
MALIFIVDSTFLELTADISCADAVQSSQVLSTGKKVLVPCALFYSHLIILPFGCFHITGVAMA